MTHIVDWAIARSRLTLSALLAVIILGTVAYLSIPKEADPDIPLPYFQVTVALQGVSPEDAERLIVRPLETQLKSIEGLKELRGIAMQGQGIITLEFDVNFNKDRAMQKVRDAVDAAKPKLPREAEEPFIYEANTSDNPVISVILSADIPERALLHAAKRLERDIDAMPGVLDAQLSGQREELLEVTIDPTRLDSYGISSEDLFRLVVANNQLIAAGSLDTGKGRFAVKVPGLFETADDVLRLPIKVKGDGVVRLGDIAQVNRTFYDANTFARWNGQPAISIDVKKRAGANIVSTIKLVRDYVEKMKPSLPTGIKVAYSGDQSYWIDAQLTQLTNAILLAVALVMIIIVGSLGLRSGLIVGVSIPTSFLIGFLCLWFGGYTLNMMVLFGMVITVGLLVDNGIIVVEYADRKMTEGFSKREAFAEGARRMFWPVVSSTAATLAAFAPLLLWPGIPGKFMSFIPITAIFVMSASMIVALLFLPTIGAIFGKPEPPDPHTERAIKLSESGNLAEIDGVAGIYARLLTIAVRRPLMIVAAALISLVAVVVAFGMFSKGVEFFVETDADFANVMVRARGNLSASEKRDLVIDVERRLIGTRGVKGIYTIAGASGGGRGGPVDTVGVMFVELLPYHERGPSKPIMADIRKRLENLPGVRAELQEQQSGPGGGKDIQIELGSENYAAQDRIVAALRAHADKMPGLIDVEDSRPLPGIEWNIKLDREQAGRFGADIGTVGAAVQLVTNGIKIGEYRPDDSDDEIDIRVRFPRGERGISALDQLRVNTRDGAIPITNFVTRTAVQQTTRFERIQGVRVWRVRANVVKGDSRYNTNERIGVLKKWIDAQKYDPSVTIKFRGSNEEQDKSAQFLIIAFALAILVIAGILLIQFNNFWHALVVLTAVVFSSIGVMLGILIEGQMFSIIMSGTGIVALMGVMVNHNIVLVDTFHHLRDRGFEPMDAIVRTGVQRLRPVILTTITAMLGLLPLMYKFDVDFFTRTVHFGGPSSDWWVPLATAIVYGMGFSTVLTLFVTPAMLAIEQRYWAGQKFWPWLVSVVPPIYRFIVRGRLPQRKSKPEAAE